MEQERPIPTERLRTVRDQMVERFSLSELRDLCFELGLNWDQLAGDTLDGKAIALLERLNRQARLPALLARLHVLHPDVAWELDDLDESAAPPYKGLAYYDRADARLFFGRERLIARLLASLRGLRQQSFLAVVGKSGSGKSSLVRAGLIPALRGERPPPEGADLPDGSPRWAYLEMTPTDRPLEQLAVTLTRDLTTAGETRAVRDDLQADPAAAPLYLRKYLERRRAPRALLLVDQFEELYAACKDEAARAAFITALLDVAEAGLTTVVITLRADFLHRFLDNARLRDALQRHQELIGAMDAAELREAVEQPALATGYELEAGLAEVIVGDTGQDAGALPLLSHALLETWRRREGWRLTHAGYNAAGGVGGAIARTAERAYADLDPAQQAIARRIFLELTELGEGAEDTRRSVPLADLLPGDPTERAAAEAVLDGLYRARLVTADETQAQVTHEALIREWPALREWLKDEREALRLERRLRAAAEEWDGGGRDPSYLYDGAQLAAACQWAAHAPRVTGTVRAFLDAATVEEGREAAERERAQQEKLAQAQRLAEEADKRAEAEAGAARTFKRWATIAGILLVVAVAVAGVAVALRNQAVRATGDAQARLLQNSSAATFESDPLLANRLLLEGMVVAGSKAAVTDVVVELRRNLLTGQIIKPALGNVIGFTNVLTGSVYVVDFQSGPDALLSGASGPPFIPLTDALQGLSSSISHSPFFIANYVYAPGELRRVDNLDWVEPLSGNINSLQLLFDGPTFIVQYDNLAGELRRVDNLDWVIPLSGNLEEVITLPNSPVFVVKYSDVPDELRRTNNFTQIKQLPNDVDTVISDPNSRFLTIIYRDQSIDLRRTDDLDWLPPLIGRTWELGNSPFYIVNHSNLPGELRRVDDPNWVRQLSGNVNNVTPPLPNSPFYIIGYSMGQDELRSTDDIDWSMPLSGDVAHIETLPNSLVHVVHYSNMPSELRHMENIDWVVPLFNLSYLRPLGNGPFFIVGYSDAQAELRSTDDFDWSMPLSGNAIEVFQFPDSPFFFVRYSDVPHELRRTNDLSWVQKLSWKIFRGGRVLNSPFFYLIYSDAPDEIRRIDDPNWIVPIDGNLVKIDYLPGSPFLVIYYDATSSELRWVDTGEVVMDETGRQIIGNADVLGDPARGPYLFYYQDKTSKIVRDDRALVNLARDVEQSLYFPETNRVAVRYGDGRVTFIDLNLIDALGGADAAKKLDAMSPEELIAFTCKTLFTDNPEWDETKLEAYLADSLPEWDAKACGE